MADRLQFAFTIMFHYLFPIRTMGLAPFVAWYTMRAAQTDDADAARAARFWTKIFAVNFATGVVTGIPMEFQFGTNWAAFSAQGGAVDRAAARDGRRLRVFPRVDFSRRAALRAQRPSDAACGAGRPSRVARLVALGVFHRRDQRVDAAPGRLRDRGRTARIEMASLWACLISPLAWWQFCTCCAARWWPAGSSSRGSARTICSAKREEASGARFRARGDDRCGLIFAVLAVFPTGDRNSANVTEYQPVKLAAMEGLFESTNGAPLAIIGMPDVANRNADRSDLRAGYLELSRVRKFQRQRQRPQRVCDRAMAAGRTDVLRVSRHGRARDDLRRASRCSRVLLLWRDGCLRSPLVLWPLMLVMPFPYIANEAGWTTTEVGRQPWIVYGMMRTSEAPLAERRQR